jgi:hypothetical protein
MNENIIPSRTNKDIFNPNPLDSTASGKRCMNASPNNAPAEKLTKYNKNLCNVSSDKEKVSRPTNDMALTIMTLINAYTNAST